MHVAEYHREFCPPRYSDLSFLNNPRSELKSRASRPNVSLRALDVAESGDAAQWRQQRTPGMYRRKGEFSQQRLHSAQDETKRASGRPKGEGEGNGHSYANIRMLDRHVDSVARKPTTSAGVHGTRRGGCAQDERSRRDGNLLSETS